MCKMNLTNKIMEFFLIFIVYTTFKSFYEDYPPMASQPAGVTIQEATSGSPHHLRFLVMMAGQGTFKIFPQNHVKKTCPRQQKKLSRFRHHHFRFFKHLLHISDHVKCHFGNIIIITTNNTLKPGNRIV